MNKTYTPWGVADHVVALNPERTVLRVGTPSHGGIGVHASVNIAPHLLRYAINAESTSPDEWRWFEEDCNWALVALALPDLFTPEQRESAEATVRNWCPDAWEAHFGRRPSAEESSRIRELELAERLKNHFRPRTAFGDWAWNVPKGHVYVLGHRAIDDQTQGFLVPDPEYQNLDTLVLDSYPHWSPDKSLPYSKPRPQPSPASAHPL